MLLTITTTREPATDLGYLLHKRPDRVQAFELTFGTAHVFYPEAHETKCTAALLVEVDPVRLVRGPGRTAGAGRTLEQYVNDRPYAASSFLSVAIGRVFRSALAAQCAAKPDLTARPLPLIATLPVLPCRGGETVLRRLFEPLGYCVDARRLPLDPAFPEWGESRYHEVRLESKRTLADLLAHLYVLIPVLDDDKHYWVGEEEVAKLLRHGERWLATHPERALITRRYLKHRPSLTRAALGRLVAEESADPERESKRQDRAEAEIEHPLSLDEQRRAAVVEAVRESRATSVLDLGCGEGRLLAALLAEKQLGKIVGVDVSVRALQAAAKRLRLESGHERVKQRLQLLQGALTYRDRRLEGFDAAALVEVIEHLDPPRLGALERVLFECARPRTVIVTTPNLEYNVRFPGLHAGALRHRDHRFEWTRGELAAWAAGVCARHPYTVTLRPIGPEDPAAGAPTQMALFQVKA